MGMAKDILAEIHAVWGELKAEGHKEADRVHAVYEHLHDLLPGVEAEVKADAAQVAHDAEAAAAPIVAETEHDAQTIAGEVTQGATAAVAEATAPAAAPAEPAK